MSERREDAFDARMRRLFAGVDTSAGFGARLAARVAALPVVSRDVLRERVERGRELAARRLRRESLTWLATAAATGAAGLALVSRHGEAVAARVAELLAATEDPGQLGAIAAAVLAACLWPVLKWYLPR